MPDPRIRLDVWEYLPSGVEIWSKLKGTSSEIDRWLNEKLENTQSKKENIKLRFGGDNTEKEASASFLFFNSQILQGL